MSPVHLIDLGFQRHQPGDREGLSRTRIPGRGHLGHSGGWQEIEVNHKQSAIHIPIKQKPQTKGLEGYGSSSSAPPTPQRPFAMEHGQKELQPGISLCRTWSKLPEYVSQRDRLQRPYGNHQRLEPHQADPTDKWPRVTILHNPRKFQEKTRIQGKKQDHLQPKEERVRPNYPEAVVFSERNIQEPEVVLHNSRISSPINRNITPTQIEYNVVTPESNLNGGLLWLQMSQYAEQTQTQFAELEASHDRMKTLTASMDKIVKPLKEGHAQLRKASEETNKRFNLVFEEQHHSKRDRDFLDQYINKLLNVYHNMKPQLHGHVMDIPYHQEKIKPDAMLLNKERSPSQYQDRDNMSYSEKEALKQLPEASSLPEFSGTGEYDCMELIYYIDGLFIDVPSIPDYWITANLIQNSKDMLVFGTQR
ncbi:hypothetical protein O181_055017 [Austropuccinia psidii MF-1]|uniref:Uncharacterized protein n=1 Tax=Austropuccinia psidii MF-1 TaxID=1389203 RepID=A0A9Q3E811_9BASI|nr:hypothetical protein [Austropuccinia psidii MF-1]